MRKLGLACVVLAAAVQSGAELGEEIGGGLPGALGDSYRMMGWVELAQYGDLGDSGITFSYRYYLLDPVEDTDKPYRLQPFLQRASYVDGSYGAGIGDSTLLAGHCRYMIPNVDIGVTGLLGLGASPAGYGQSAFGGGMVYYFGDENNFALELDLSRRTEERLGGGPPPKPVVATQTGTFLIGARYIWSFLRTGGMLELDGGYRLGNVDGAPENGIRAEVRYYFNKNAFAGGTLGTDTGRLSVCGGYAAGKVFQGEIELGRDGDVGGSFLRLQIGLRF